MKNLIALVSILLFISLAVFAQTETEKQVEWKTFSPQSEEFSVEVPDSLVAYSLDQKDESRRYTGLFNGTYYFIFSDNQKENFQHKTVLKFIEANQKDELGKQKKSSMMKFSFSDDENFYHTIYTAKTKKRAYVFHIVSPQKNNPSVNRFFDNLKINEKLLSNVGISEDTKIEIANPDNDKIENNKKSLKTISGSGQGNGSGNGTGSGSGEGSGFGPPKSDDSQPLNKGENTPLNITFKPRPKYTDFARFYEISGDVRVRMTFLTNGTIGSTTPLTKLPFGLTNSAITAAKKVGFEPMIAKGKPVTVTKVVVFAFSTKNFNLNKLTSN